MLRLATPAKADEAVHNWTGLYVGVNAGYAWNKLALENEENPRTIEPKDWTAGG